ncbi:MAG: hypothetical protein O2861_07865 [Proteobacteria bacterium]|nr:hypothetical protein [Pseudomonadota bacterium]
MISTVIVVSSLLMATLFTAAYLLSPAMRAKVEAPKFVFLKQLAEYDQSMKNDPHAPSEVEQP